MVYSILKGGLGNQLFQYAAAKELAKIHNIDFSLITAHYERHKDRNLVIDQLLEIGASHFLEQVPKNPGLLKKILNRLKPSYKRYYVKEKLKGNYSEFKQFSANVILDGYWQYLEIAESIAIELKSKLVNKANLQASNTVAVHFRGGDYLKAGNKDLFNLGETYYKKAFELFNKDIENVIFHLFSDTPIHFQFPFLESFNCRWVNNPKETADFIALCHYQNFIIANSTFSWWPAFLSGKSVVAPKKWFNLGLQKKNYLVSKEWRLI